MHSGKCLAGGLQSGYTVILTGVRYSIYCAYDSGGVAARFYFMTSETACCFVLFRTKESSQSVDSFV